MSDSRFWANASIIRRAPTWRVIHKGPMLVTEHGFTFIFAADVWRCVERPELLMLRSGRYRIEGRKQEFPTSDAALAAELESEEGRLEPGAARPTRGYFWGYVGLVTCSSVRGISYLARLWGRDPSLHPPPEQAARESRLRHGRPFRALPPCLAPPAPSARRRNGSGRSAGSWPAGIASPCRD
jgi:hypothetical protein